MHEGIGDIIQLLNNGRIKEALTQLQAIGSQTAQWDIQSQIESASTAYSTEEDDKCRNKKCTNKIHCNYNHNCGDYRKCKIVDR